MKLFVIILALFVADKPQIQWQPDWDKAFEIAKKERKPVLIAINMDGESANKEVAERVYKDKKVIRATRYCLPIICSLGQHALKDGSCTRFKGIKCINHVLSDQKLRRFLVKKEVIKEVTQPVFAPQHILVDPICMTIIEHWEFNVGSKQLTDMIIKARKYMLKEHK